MLNAEIHGIVWNDLNGNGVQDAGEPALAGQTVYLDTNQNGQLDAGEPVATTAADGSYAFTGLSAGTFNVRVVLPSSGWGETAPQAPTADRLFATTADGSNQIEELNPSDGSVLNHFAAPAPITPWTDGLAYDGTSLYYMGPWGSDQLWQLNPNTGAVIQCIPITGGSGDFSGVAALDGNLYVEDMGADKLRVLNPSTGQFTQSFNIGNLDGGLAFTGGIAAIHGPDTIVAVGNCGGPVVVEINPTSGLVTHSFTPYQNNNYYGVACLDDQIYLGYLPAGRPHRLGEQPRQRLLAPGRGWRSSIRPATFRPWAATIWATW